MVCRKRPNERDYDNVSAVRSRRPPQGMSGRDSGEVPLSRIPPLAAGFRKRNHHFVTSDGVNAYGSSGVQRPLSQGDGFAKNGRLEKTSIISPIPQSGIMNSHSKPEPSDSSDGEDRTREPRSTVSLTFRLSFHSVTSIPT